MKFIYFFHTIIDVNQIRQPNRNPFRDSQRAFSRYIALLGAAGLDSVPLPIGRRRCIVDEMRAPGTHRRWRRLTNRLATLAVLVKLVSPAGFMPADLSGGHWLMICPDGLPSGVFDNSQHDHGHGGHDKHDGPEGDDHPPQLGLDHCPIGAAVGAPSIVSDHDSVACAAIRELVAEIPRLPALRPYQIAALARAPPATILS